MPRYLKFLLIGIGVPVVIILFSKKSFATTKFIPMSVSGNQSSNLKAFLLMLQYAEGTIGINAYRTLFGGGLFSDLSVHPNHAITKSGITSTAAGAYQFLYRTWSALQDKLKLPDFGPQSQDAGAIELIRQKGALTDVMNGNIPIAINKVQKIWASLPGAGYGQRELKLNDLVSFYRKSGGALNVG